VEKSFQITKFLATAANTLVTYPIGYAQGRRVPLSLNVHGGSSGVFSQYFNAGRFTYPIAAFAA
jgi:dipeptidyl aminopeptidase/acylaminoacyl peptidase